MDGCPAVTHTAHLQLHNWTMHASYFNHSTILYFYMYIKRLVQYCTYCIIYGSQSRIARGAEVADVISAPTCYQSPPKSAHGTNAGIYQSPFQYLAKSQSREICLKIIQPLWNFTGGSTAALARRLSNFKATCQFKLPISRLRDLTRSYNKTSYRILKRAHDVHIDTN